MEPRDYRSTIRRMYELISAGDIDGFGELLADDFVHHDTKRRLERTRDGMMEFFRTLRASFPDLRIDVEDMFVSGNKVMARARATGTHTGETFMGLPTTGKSVTVELFDVALFGDDGRIHEHWGFFDSLSMLQQLGAVMTAPVASAS